jgi:hypothetical protein
MAQRSVVAEISQPGPQPVVDADGEAVPERVALPDVEALGDAVAFALGAALLLTAAVAETLPDAPP